MVIGVISATDEHHENGLSLAAVGKVENLGNRRALTTNVLFR